MRTSSHYPVRSARNQWPRTRVYNPFLIRNSEKFHALRIWRWLSRIGASVTLTTIIGSIAAILSVTSFAPQALRIIRTRETKGLSTKTYLLTATGFALWSVFGILKMEWPIIVPNILCLLLSGFILTMLILPRREMDRVADAIDPDAA